MPRADLHMRAKALFLQAQLKAPEERSAYLREACANDDELRAEVESLLAFAVQPTDTGVPDALSPSIDTLQPGDRFDGRYRVIELLGRGGMGEVYRVRDEVMQVDVALKRLVGGTDGDQGRLLHEVQLARQVTHPAVCRVHDVGRWERQLYFTMEYVDGEDLATLLRRIGRIPAAKVIDIARQACAGLASAHAVGILHRDLKPANLMIDRLGNVRITDFGIAVQGPPEVGQIAGTPAYMAPEQLRGQPASPQSDLFSLAVLLYELVTGRHPFEPRGRGTVPDPAGTVVSDVDPRLDRALLSALADDPQARPSSALAFAATLPGVDALRVALEAGQLPSPNLVAAAGTGGTLSPRAALGLVALGFASLALVLVTTPARLVDRIVMPEQPATLAAGARTFLQTVSGEPSAPYRAHRVIANEPYLRGVPRHQLTSLDGARLAHVIYRESRQPLLPAYVLGEPEAFALTAANPPLQAAGDRAVVMDAVGRIVSVTVWPPPDGEDRAVDWMPFLRASGIDISTVTGDPPAAAPHARWEARLLDGGAPVRVAAHTAAGRVVRFEVRHRHPEDVPAAVSSSASDVVAMVFSLGVVPLVCFRAWRHLRSRQGDRRGAARLAAALFVCTVASTVLGATFMPPRFEFQRLAVMVGWHLLLALVTAAFYLAFEPAVRRRWPWSLIAWSRLLAGRFRDPLVARDMLIGVVVALASTALYQVLVSAGIGLTGSRPTAFAFSVLMGPRQLLAALLAGVPQALSGGMILVLLYSVLVGLLHRPWAAGITLVALLVGMNTLQTDLPPAEFLAQAAAFALVVWLFGRLGLVTLVAFLFAYLACNAYPLSFASAWRGELAIVTIAVLAAITLTTAANATRASVPSTTHDHAATV